MSRNEIEITGRTVASWAGVGVVVLAVATVVLGSWYTVNDTQRAVVLRNGAFVAVEQPGLHFKLPWIEDVVKVDMQTHTYTWTKVNAYSADQQPANMKISVTTRLEPDKVREFYNRFGGDTKAAVSRLIEPQVNKESKIVFGTFTAVRSVTQRGMLNSDITTALNNALAYDPIFKIETINVEDIDFSPEYIKSVESRMQAEVDVQKKKQELEKEKVQAELVETTAKGKANAVRQEAMAAAEAITLRGNAEATAIRARAEALAQNGNLVLLTQAEKWDGKLPTSMPPNGTVPMLNLTPNLPVK